MCLEHILSVRSTFTCSSVGMDFLHLYLCPQEEPLEIKGLQCCSKTVNEQSCKHFSPPKWRHLADAPFLEAARPWSCSWTGGVKLQILSITQQCKSIWGPVCIASALWYNHILPSQNYFFSWFQAKIRRNTIPAMSFKEQEVGNVCNMCFAVGHLTTDPSITVHPHCWALAADHHWSPGSTSLSELIKGWDWEQYKLSWLGLQPSWSK